MTSASLLVPSSPTAADVAEVRLVDRDDLVGELVTELVDLRLGERVVVDRVVGARREVVIRVLVERRVEAVDAFDPAERPLGDVDVDGRAVGGGSS